MARQRCTLPGCWTMRWEVRHESSSLPFPVLLLALLFAVAAGLSWFNLNIALPRAQWGERCAPDIRSYRSDAVPLQLAAKAGDFLLVGGRSWAGGGVVPAGIAQPAGGTDHAWRGDWRSTGDYRHHTVGDTGRAGFAVCRTGGRVCCGLAGVWRGTGANGYRR